MISEKGAQDALLCVRILTGIQHRRKGGGSPIVSLKESVLRACVLVSERLGGGNSSVRSHLNIAVVPFTKQGKSCIRVVHEAGAVCLAADDQAARPTRTATRGGPEPRVCKFSCVSLATCCFENFRQQKKLAPSKMLGLAGS